jgi:tRNA (guanine-N7-)-methyltransferase
MTPQNSTIDRPPPLLDPELVPNPIRWSELFGNSNPVELEIGSGKGLFLVNAATANPGHNFFGIEIAKKYAGLAAQRVVKNNLSNVRVWAGDAKPVIATMIPPQSVQVVHVYFPDPWWKKRHKKRRVFTGALVDDIQRLLVNHGQLSVASDVEEYFHVIRDLVAARPQFRELPPGEVREPEHDLDYLTNFERKFRIEGRSIHRARYQFTAIL